MNKKTWIKILICVISCVAFAVVGNRMPLLMRAVYNAVFSEFDHVALFFVLGVLVFEVVLLRRWGHHKYGYGICIGIAVAAASLVLFDGETSFVDKLAPGAETTLIGRVVSDSTIDEADIQKIFVQYYFEDRQLIVSDEERSNADLQYIFDMAVPPRNIVTEGAASIADDAAETILSYPCREYESSYFVLDEFWEETESIRLVTWGDSYIFCSEKMFDDNAAFTGGGADLFETAKSRPFREAKQTAVMLLLLLIGCAVSIPLWGEKYPYLSFFLGLPLGAAVWCVCGIFFMMFAIPYHLVSMLACILVFAGVWLYRKRNRLKAVDWTAFLNFILAAVAVMVFLAYIHVCYTSADSLMKCAYGQRLARYGSMRDILGSVAPYGMLEPMIQSIGYLVDCDALYVFYPLMAVSGTGIMCTGMSAVNGKKTSEMSVVVLGAGMLFLFTNFDFVMSHIVMAAHGPIAVYTLILLMFVVLQKRIGIAGFEGIAALAASMVLLTRVEGAVYVLFFLALSLGIEDESLKMGRVNLFVAGVILAWNVFQMILVGHDANPTFWTPERGLILVAGAAFLLLITWLAGRDWSLVKWVKKYCFPLAVGAICFGITAVAVLAARETASINLPFFLSHLSNNSSMNSRINAGAVWTFLLLLAPIVISTKSRVAQYAVSLIGGYVLLIFFVCLFRTEVPLHYGYFDSGRRTLVQIMPAAVWLLAYSAGERENSVRIKDGK